MNGFDDPLDTWTVAIDADTSALQAELRTASNLGRQFSRSMVSAFEGIAIKGRSVGDALKGLALRLSDLVVRAAFKPLEQGFGNALSGLFSGGLGVCERRGVPGWHAGALCQGVLPMARPYRFQILRAASRVTPLRSNNRTADGVTHVQLSQSLRFRPCALAT